jgi:hypothetical protein
MEILRLGTLPAVYLSSQHSLSLNLEQYWRLLDIDKLAPSHTSISISVHPGPEIPYLQSSRF